MSGMRATQWNSRKLSHHKDQYKGKRGDHVGASHLHIKYSAITMSNHHKINYIEFPADDLPKVKEFYSQAFGWSFTDYGPEYTAFNDGSLDGGFTAGTQAQGSGPLVILYSNDLQDSLETIERYGGKITKPIFDFPGGRRFHFADPVGNELAVWSEK